jgi:hypothetical protein
MEIGADSADKITNPLRHNGFQRFLSADSVAIGVPTCRQIACFPWLLANGLMDCSSLVVARFAHYSAVAGILIAVEL